MRLLLACVIFVGAAPAWAAPGDGVDPSVARAKEIVKRAQVHYNLGKFSDAAAEFEQVYELHPDAVLLYNVAQCHRLNGDMEKALFFYRSYLRNQPNAPNRAEVEGRITELESVVAAKARTQARPPNNPAPLDRAVPPTSEVAPPPAVVPPPETAAQSVAVKKAPPPPTTSAEPVPLYKKWWLWTAIAGVVVVGAVVAVIIATTTGGGFQANLPDTGPAAPLVRF